MKFRRLWSPVLLRLGPPSGAATPTPTRTTIRDISPIGADPFGVLGLCSIDLSFTKSRFYLLGPDWVPVVSTLERQLQPLCGGHAQEATLDDPFAGVPVFSFQKSSSASAGVYDLVITGPEPQYVAKGADGRLILTSAASPRASNVLATSIFTVDCDGSIGVMHEGVAYSWNIIGDPPFIAGVNSSDGTVIAYNLARTPRKLAIRNEPYKPGTWNTGDAPRCPNGGRPFVKTGVALRPPTAAVANRPIKSSRTTSSAIAAMPMICATTTAPKPIKRATTTSAIAWITFATDIITRSHSRSMLPVSLLRIRTPKQSRVLSAQQLSNPPTQSDASAQKLQPFRSPRGTWAKPS
jgi:hypothetical protein